MTEPSEIPLRLLKDLNEARSKHLTYAQLEGFVDSRVEATERDYVRAHIDLCTQCNRELEDLQWFSESHVIGSKSPLPRSQRGPVSGRALASGLKFSRGLAMAGVAIAMAVLIAVVVKMQTRSSEQPSVQPLRHQHVHCNEFDPCRDGARGCGGAAQAGGCLAIPVSSSRSGGIEKEEGWSPGIVGG